MSPDSGSATPMIRYGIAERTVSLLIDESLYPLDAIYGAAYIFIDRCFVFLDRPAEALVEVRLRARRTAAEEELDALAGEFANELLNQTLRLRLAQQTARVRDYYVARAFAPPGPAPTIDAILAELDAEELSAGDLDIRLPWQQPVQR